MSSTPSPSSWAVQIQRATPAVKNNPDDYVTRLWNDPASIDRAAWNALLALQDEPTPFVRHEYLSALHESASAIEDSGWTPCFLTLWRGAELHAACPMYLKDHSYG